MLSEAGQSRPARRSILLGAAALAACRGGESSLSRVKLTLGDQQRGLRIMADATGAFRNAPYQVAWANFVTPTPLFEAIASGFVDTALAVDNLILQSAILGRSLKIVAVARASSRSIGIVVPGDSSIRSVKDLVGKNIVVSTTRGGTADSVLWAALAEAGVAAAKVRVGYMLQSDAMAAFLSRHVDAWVTNDPQLARVERAGGRVLRDGTGLFKAVSFFAIGEEARRDAGKRAAVGDALNRLADAGRWRNAHPADYLRVYTAQTGLDPEIARITVARRGGDVLEPITEATIRDAQAVADGYAARGLFPHSADVRPFFDATVFAPRPAK